MMPEANLVGGSERDREQILQLHADYIDANARFDWRKLEPIWSPAPEAVFFNLNGHTYKGREHWVRLWKFYGQNLQSSYWTPVDLGGVLSDAIARAWCHRRTKRHWTGAATRRIGIGIGVCSPYNRHPTLMAMEIGALDELAQGRARLAIGSGIAAATERLGVSTDRPLAAVRDAITIVRAMLKGEEVNYAGGVFSAHKGKLEYRALRPALPPLMAARGDQALALCGKIADRLMISNMGPAEFTEAAVRAVHASARQARRPAPAEVPQYIPCAVRLDRAPAYGLAHAAIRPMLPSFWSLRQPAP